MVYAWRVSFWGSLKFLEGQRNNIRSAAVFSVLCTKNAYLFISYHIFPIFAAKTASSYEFTGCWGLRAARNCSPCKVSSPFCRGHIKKGKKMPMIALPTILIIFCFYIAFLIYLWAWSDESASKNNFSGGTDLICIASICKLDLGLW